MALAFNAVLQNNMLDEIGALIDAGAGAGVIEIYDGARPATGAAITTETLLASLTMDAASFGAANAGSASAAAITGDAAADATGTASWFRVTDSVGTFIMDGDVGVAGADLNLTTVSINIGVAVDITSFVLNAGNS
tara:strand:- start:41714 stop:42121 length:408 start_codon:yes stop_codon:yes gene_type:complete